MAATAELGIAKIGVIGAGQMGSGIAHVCALAGLDVAMVDVNAAALEKALANIGRNIDRQVAKGTVTAEAKGAALARIATATDYAPFADADLVIEAATEKAEVKKTIFRALCAALKPEAIIASNTSSISITGLAAVTDRPQKFIGMHFMNPVPVMKLIEVIRGIATDEPTFQAIQALAAKLGKTTAVSEDFPAFIVNRILVPMINEAVYALYEGVGNITSIDTAMKLGANHRWGRSSSPTSSASIRACRSCRCSMTASPTASTGPARCS
jgi:3-hydroxybutyryl-CoA dehydrogenase